MTKKKLHQLLGTIKHCFLGKVNSKSSYKNNPFYYLEIEQQSLFTSKKEVVIYAFSNLVSKDI